MPEGYGKNRTLAGVIVVGLIGFLYPLMHVFNELKTWQGAWEQPSLAAQLIWCLICALIAMGAAMGLNVANLLRGVGINIGTPTAPAEKAGV